MYDFISGTLVEKTPTYAVIDAGGVGYYLNISLSTFSAIAAKEKVMLYAHLAIKEDAHNLFGFATRSERETFRMLIQVSGVGASTARMILSSLSAEEIAECVMFGQVAKLKAVKGIGEKTAQRILIDLKGKFDGVHLQQEIFSSPHNTIRFEALTALTLLGFPKAAAEKALDKALKSSNENLTVEELIKQSLKII
jgi:Holliday junction DNA helicase RuvA